MQRTFKTDSNVRTGVRAHKYTHNLLGVSAALSKFTWSDLILERSQLEGRLVH